MRRQYGGLEAQRTALAEWDRIRTHVRMESALQSTELVIHYSKALSGRLVGFLAYRLRLYRLIKLLFVM
jgi:hypothetical protein